MARNVKCGLRLFQHSLSFLRNTKITDSNSGCHRSFYRWHRPTFMALYKRRKEAGPEPIKPRSSQINWNYAGELYAFGKRLGEDFHESTLRQSFTHKSYVDKAAEERRELGVREENISLTLPTNETLAEQGSQIISIYLKAFLRYAYPNFPEEGISAVHDYLTTNNMLEYIGKNLGMYDLILSADFPPSASTVATTFKAVVGALSHDLGLERAHLFVQDFVLTQLVNQDINELWTMVNPMGVLAAILEKHSFHPPEPRVLRNTGSSTVVACYEVGIYCNKRLLGRGYGETALIAEEMAAREVLKRIFGTDIRNAPPKFGQKGRNLQLSLHSKNLTIDEMCGKAIESKFTAQQWVTS